MDKDLKQVLSTNNPPIVEEISSILEESVEHSLIQYDNPSLSQISIIIRISEEFQVGAINKN